MESNQLTKQETDKIFSMYLPCIVKCGKQIGWPLSQKTYPADIDFYCQHRYRNLKLLLTPLSHITDEHAIEVASITMKAHNRHYQPEEISYKITSRSDKEFFFIEMHILVKDHERYKIRLEGDNIRTMDVPIGVGTNYVSHGKEYSSHNQFGVYQFLISKGYDVPLWFLPDHWANGKTAIELGIAISNTNNQST